MESSSNTHSTPCTPIIGIIEDNIDSRLQLSPLPNVEHEIVEFGDLETRRALTNTTKGHSEEDILNIYNNADEQTFVRRISLPENYLTKVCTNTEEDCLKSPEIKETSESTASTANINLGSVQREKQIDKKNISEVVKNVHGLFSLVGGSLKSAYKPMEKNLSGMVLATQRNLAMAKHGDRAKKSFTSSNTDETLFKKCDKFPSNEKISTNQEVKEDEKIQKSLVISIDSNEKRSSENVLLEQSPSKECSLKKDEVVDVYHIENSENINFSNSHATLDNFESIDSVKDRNITLENTVCQLSTQLNVLKMSLTDKDVIKKNLESKMNLFMKQLETVTAERDASVMRYAVSERNALEAIKAKDIAITSEQNAKREVSMITQRLRTANADRTRASGALDMKCHELSLAQKDILKLKEEVQAAEVKLKWAQSKLVSEMDSHKESSALIEKLTAQLKQMGGETICPSLLMSQSEIDSQLREKDATIILEKHEKEKFETRSKQLQAELDLLKNAFNSANNEIKELRAQVESGTAESAALRRTCSELRDQGAKDCDRLAAAQARAARCDTLATHLQQEQDRSTKLVQELEDMRALREEALAEGELRIRREAELLRQAERLTAAGVKLQAQCSEAEAKALALTVDNDALKEAAVRAAAEAAAARADLGNEREGRAADARALASRAAQHARGEREALAALESARGELRVASTKHASALKEMKREYLQVKRKCERYEVEGKLLQISDKVSSEKTGSSSSLSSYEGFHNHSDITNSVDSQLLQSTPDNQQLVEKIVNLQRAAAKRSEKLEFMEEHNRQLTQELQKKTRVLRSLLLTVPSGKLTSAASDAAKAEIGRHGGVMASVYGSQVTDETMTLELSLEINAKLQSLLEDTLLSNITLKENMDTLGDEITRLKENKKTAKNRKD